MKKFASMLLAIIICFAVSIPALAAEQPGYTETAGGEIVVYAVQTQWYYRVYNGQAQKRLWSITYGYWLTDWMPY